MHFYINSGTKSTKDVKHTEELFDVITERIEYFKRNWMAFVRQKLLVFIFFLDSQASCKSYVERLNGSVIFYVDSRFISISFSLSSLLPLGVLLVSIFFLTSLLSIFVHSMRTHCMCVLPLSLLLLLFLPVSFSFSFVPYIFLLI